ncbi:hypothetical protein [Paracoccus sanguinis]|uniref:hypothetical protein n=1 Tax=Paracoccus sanguinis TaxID=1545044 RepID=UPI0009422B9F|nr:hypothetical protein [Paracoccus sanguinis]
MPVYQPSGLEAVIAAAAVPAVRDRLHPGHPEATHALAAAVQVVRAAAPSNVDIDNYLLPHLDGPLWAAIAPKALADMDRCRADVRACLALAAARTVAADADGCRLQAYAVGLAAPTEAVAEFQRTLGQGALENDPERCLGGVLAGMAVARPVTAMTDVLEDIADTKARVTQAGVASEHLAARGRAAEVRHLLTELAGGAAATGAGRGDLLNLLARYAVTDAGLEVIGTAEANEDWVKEMERFRRDLRHHDHESEAAEVAARIEAKTDRSALGAPLRQASKLGGLIKRTAGDGLATAGRLFDEDDPAPTAWPVDDAPLIPEAIARLPADKQFAAYKVILGRGDVATRAAAAELMAATAEEWSENMAEGPVMTDLEWSEVVLAQVRARRDWPAAAALERIEDLDLRARTAAQAVIDWQTQSPARVPPPAQPLLPTR